MTKRRLKVALYAAGFAMLSTTPNAVLSAKSQQNQQGSNTIGDLIGMITGTSAKSKAKRGWAQITPEIQQCVNTVLAAKNANVERLISAAIPPTDPKVASVIELCQETISVELKTNYPCYITNANGQRSPTYCSQHFTKKIDGKWVQISRDDYLRAVGRGENVDVGDFETARAQSARLAAEQREESAILRGQSPMLSTNAQWVRKKGGGPAQYFDQNSINKGNEWTNYRGVVVYRQNDDVNGASVTSDFRITDTAVQCSGSSIPYVIFIQTHYFVGKFDPNNPRATALNARMVAQDTKPTAFTNASWQGEVAAMCGSAAVQTGFALNENQRKVVERARAFDAPRLARELEEARRRPRGYMVACSGTRNSGINLYFVNCGNPLSVQAGFRWAYNRLLGERSDGRHFASGCLENLRKYSDVHPSAATNPQVINGFLAPCNVGLQYVQGPSAADAAARKK